MQYDENSYNTTETFFPILEIRPPKTTGVVIEGTAMEHCLSKAKFTSAEGCEGTWAQHAQRDRAVCPSLCS
jgi:hypothetical protein